MGTLKHGYAKRKNRSKEYNVWVHMKARCYNKNAKDYHLYGALGVIVCERWLQSFENFLYDMGERPTNKHSIDRINVTGNYEPSNCRWTTQNIQNQNKRCTNTNGYTGVSKRIKKGKWNGTYQIQYAKKYLGCSSDIVEAAKIYDRYVYKLLGDMAKLNFPLLKEEYYNDIR